MGIAQNYGRVYPGAVSISKESANFDFMFISSTRRATAGEVMSGWRPEQWRGKRRLAERFVANGISALFIGARPPWEPPAQQRDTVTLLGPEGRFNARGSGAASADWEPPGIFYVSEPELCDASGEPWIARLQ